MSLPAKRLEAQPIDHSKWIAADEAAKILDRNLDALTRECRQSLSTFGQAMLTSPGRGQKRWYINRAYDRRLAIHQVQPATGVDRLTDRQRLVYYAKVDCINEYRRLKETSPHPQRVWLPPLAKALNDKYTASMAEKGIVFTVSPRGLAKWDNEYDPANPDKLADKRGGDQRGQGDPEAWDHFKKLFLHQNGPSAAHCWELVKDWAKDCGFKWCSKKSMHNQLRLGTRIPKATQIFHREPAKYRSLYEPHTKQDSERHAAGECWVGDHRPLDLICRIADRFFRPSITTFLDWRTRRIVGYVVSEYPDSSTIMLALRSAILDPLNNGPPDMVWIDNGKDYQSYSLHGATRQQRKNHHDMTFDELEKGGLLRHLQIEPHFSIPYGPQGKARMEGWYPTCANRFDKNYDTYTGKSPECKPERLKEVIDKAKDVPTFSRIEEDFARFVQWYNARSDHAMDDLVNEDGTRLSPNHAMQIWNRRAKRLSDPSALNLLLQMHHKPVPVRRNGITLTIKGQAIQYGGTSVELIPFKEGKGKPKQLVRVTYDPMDLGKVRVFTPQWRFICDAPMNATGGVYGLQITQDIVREEARKKTAYRKAVRVVTQEEPRQKLMAFGERLEETAHTKPLEPTSIKPVQTLVDGQSKEVQRHARKRAAGLENTRVIDDDDGGLSSPSILSDLAPGAPRHDDWDDALPGPMPFHLDASTGDAEERPVSWSDVEVDQ